HSVALSEAAFVLFSLLGFLMLHLYIQRSQIWILIGAAALTVVAYITRYAGIACIFAGLGFLWVLLKTSWMENVQSSVVFISVAWIPMALWMLRNAHYPSGLTGRHIQFHQCFGPDQTMELAKSFVVTVLNWQPTISYEMSLAIV